MLKSKLSYFTFILLSVLTQNIYASFEIFDEDSEGYYGSAQTRPLADWVK